MSSFREGTDMKGKQLVKPKKHNFHLKEILFIFILFFIPKLIHPTLASTTNILKNFTHIFLNSGVYVTCIIFLLNSLLVFVAISFLINKDLKIKSKIIFFKNKTFFKLFIGFFIYLLFLSSIFIEKSIKIQNIMGKDINDIVYTLTVFSIFLVFIIIFMIRKDFYLGDMNIGSFILLFLGSSILFETFIGFSPLKVAFEIFISNDIIEDEIAIRFIAPYYFSILGSIILSIIDIRFLNDSK